MACDSGSQLSATHGKLSRQGAASASKTGGTLTRMWLGSTAFRHSWRRALACLSGLNPVMVRKGRTGPTPVASATLDSKLARALGPVGNRLVSRCGMSFELTAVRQLGHADERSREATRLPPQMVHC
jgi:hypothetical protein